MIARWIAGAVDMGPGSGKGVATDEWSRTDSGERPPGPSAEKGRWFPAIRCRTRALERSRSVRLLELHGLEHLSRALVQHHQVARGQRGAAAGDGALEVGPFADLEAAQPGGLDHRQQLAGARRLLGGPVQQ